MAKFQFPSLFILGAAKSGTTSLYEILKRHPDVYMSFVKEPMFFSKDDYYAMGKEWYAQTFFPATTRTRWQGDATPHYLYWADKVAARMQKDLTDTARFIIILRDPAERAYSWYWNMIKEGEEKLSFEEALAQETARIKTTPSLKALGSMKYGYKKGSRYASQIKYFLNCFPTDRFLFLLQEDLKDAHAKTLSKLYAFLDIRPIEAIPQKSNPSVQPYSHNLQNLLRQRSAGKEVLKRLLPFKLRHSLKTYLLERNRRPFTYPKMNAETLYMLRHEFASEVTELQSLINRDLAHWLPGNQ